MTLIKTSLLNAVSVSIKLLTLLGINKILAIYVGPAGYVALGNFQNALQIITTLGSAGVGTGVTKYTAEYYDDELRQRKVWKTAGTICLIGSVIVSVIVWCFNNTLAVWFFKDEDLGSIFSWLAVTLIFFVFNSLLLSILNGRKEIHLFVLINIIGSIFSFVISAVLLIQFALYGALLAIVISQSLIFFVSFIICYRKEWFNLNFLIGVIDAQVAVKLAKYISMALVSAVMLPVSNILVRNIIGESIGMDAAGYWEAMLRLSSAYLMFVTSVLGVYFLPRFSELKNYKAIKYEITQGYKIILPLSICCSLLIFTSRDYVINMVFTDEFMPMRDLFAWQLLGDSLKIASWILAYIMIGRAYVGMYIYTEIFFSLGFVGLTWLLVDAFGLKAAVIAHALNYLIYWALVAFLMKNKLKKDLT